MPKPVSIERGPKSWKIEYNFKRNQPYLSRVSNSLNSASGRPLSRKLHITYFALYIFCYTYLCLCKLCQYLPKSLLSPHWFPSPTSFPSFCSSQAETLFSIFPLIVYLMHNLCFQGRSETQRVYKKRSIRYYF